LRDKYFLKFYVDKCRKVVYNEQKRGYDILKLKRKILTAAGVCVAVIFAVGVVLSIAAGNYGTEEDPLVTLSYLNDVLTKQITEQVNADFDAKLNTLETAFNSKVDELLTSDRVSASYVVLTLSKGQTVKCSVGAEIIHRLGSTVCVSDGETGLIDNTDAGVLRNGDALSANHLYLVSIDGRGLKATSDSATVLIRGGYKVS